MVEVRVVVDNLKDNENYNKEIIVKRNGSEIKLKQKLLQKGDIYSVTKERCAALIKANAVEEIKEERPQKNKSISEENKGE